MRKGIKLATVFVGTAFASATILVGCGSGGSTTTPSNNKGYTNNPDGVFRELGGWTAPPQYQGNPFGSGGVGSAYTYIYIGLFQFIRSTDKVYNRLAASVDYSNPTKTVVKIRPDAKWSDGQPFTSKDVWAYYTLNDGTDLTKFLTSIDTPDDHTVVFNWINPAPFDLMKKLFLAQDEQDQIPYHLYKTYADKAAQILASASTDTDPNDVGKYPFQKKLTDAQQKEWNDNWNAFTKDDPKMPVGAGPYKVQKVTQNQMVLVKNPYFYDASNVKFKTVENVQVNDLNQQYALLKAGKLDRYDGTQPKDILESILAANKNLVHYMMFDPASVGFIFNVTHKPFDNITFRKAIIYALDRSKITEVGNYYAKPAVWSTTGMPPSAVATYVSKDVQAKMTKFPYDPNKATQLLESIGWKKGADGKWQDPTGKTPNFTIASDGTWVPAVNSGEVIAEQLTQFGLPTQYKAVDSGVYWTQVWQNNAKGDPYDLHFDWVDVSWGFNYPWSPESNYWYNTFEQTGWDRAKNGNPNFTGTDWVGNKVDPYALLQKIPYMPSDQERSQAIDQLAYVANETAIAVNIFQNVTGQWLNMKTIGGVPWQSAIAKYDRNMPLPPASLVEKVAETNFGGDMLLFDGSYYPN